jgi:predicted RNase H-like HicB family nuclease
MRYELIIYWSKADETFVVEVPELPGCMADGGTYEDAVANPTFATRGACFFVMLILVGV